VGGSHQSHTEGDSHRIIWGRRSFAEHIVTDIDVPLHAR